ncbi:hypothetical protein [Rothia aeria]|uniref:hypothetical protein n=1 Tax=Rothia aeria TaxID=172042 RepID=UPI00254F6D74|nr:hypothetical protein [Rothia aeria]MDK7353682.1 hypothetical protein [Rothia aeria]
MSTKKCPDAQGFEAYRKVPFRVEGSFLFTSSSPARAANPWNGNLLLSVLITLAAYGYSPKNAQQNTRPAVFGLIIMTG